MTGGEVHDSVCASALLDGKKADFVMADKAYDSDKILNEIDAMGAVAVIPAPLQIISKMRNHRFWAHVSCITQIAH